MSRLYVLALASLIISSNTFAASLKGEISSNKVDFTVEALYLQPTNTGLSYGVTSKFIGAGELETGVVDQYLFDPDYKFGFRLGLGYTLGALDVDFRVNWTRFNNSYSDDYVLGPDSLLTTGFTPPFSNVPPVTQSGNAPADYSGYSLVTERSDLDINLDSVDIDVGQYVNINNRLRTRLFAGIRYAHVEVTQTNTSEGSPTFDPVSPKEIAIYSQTSKYDGVGPRIGVDALYYLGKGIGFVAQASGAILIGKDDIYGNTQHITSPFQQNNFLPFAEVLGEASANKKNRAVEAFDLKLGLNYMHVFQQKYIATIEGGFMATRYIDVVEKVAQAPEYVTNQNTSGPNRIGTLVTSITSSLTFNGPYLNLNIKF